MSDECKIVGVNITTQFVGRAPSSMLIASLPNGILSVVLHCILLICDNLLVGMPKLPSHAEPGATGPGRLLDW